jgi:transposase
MLQLKGWKMIRELKKSGLNITEISRKLGVSKLDNYKKYIDERLEKYNLSSIRIFEEVNMQGYIGKYGIVNQYVKQVKTEHKTIAVLRFETMPGARPIVGIFW